MAALAAGRPFDRIPCVPMLSEHAALVLGVSTAEYNRSGSLLARGQIAAYRRYGHDSVGVGPGSTGLVEAAGSKVVLPEASTPYVAEYVVTEKSDLDRLALPDPRRDGRLPHYLEALARLVDELGDEVPVSAGVGGPVSTASNLRSPDRFLRDLRTDPDFAHRLLEFALSLILAFVREAAKLPVGFTITDPMSSGSLISPALYRDFAFPYQQRLIDGIVAASGRRPVLHVCGNSTRNWQAMAETGAGALSLDDVIDLAEARRQVGDRITLTGNIRPTATMLLGTPRTVEDNVKECLRQAWDTPKGFVLAMGCGLPIRTPPENLHALVAAARRYGQWPYDPERFAA
ncbi:Uroporphyrinogen decarboxylase [Rhodovastum atsumiense]|nr:Uroporphyrinogen decarboxylase [Rhodovastum atsumiense]